MENFISIIIFLLIGLFLQRSSLDDSFAISINKLLINVSLPATILLVLPKVKIDSSLLTPMITPYIVFAISIAIALVIAKVYDIPKDLKAALLLLLPLGNTSFLGFPMIEALCGKDAIGYAIIYDQLGSFIFLSIYGAIIVSIYSGDKVDILSLLKKLFRFVPFISLLISLIIGRIQSIEFVLIPLSNMLTPLAMISVGFMLRVKISEYRKVFIFTLFAKLIAIPLVVFIMFKLLGLDDIVARVTLLESAMPTMITAGAIATMSGFAPRFSNAVVGYGIIISFITIPIFNILF